MTSAASLRWLDICCARSSFLPSRCDNGELYSNCRSRFHCNPAGSVVPVPAFVVVLQLRRCPSSRLKHLLRRWRCRQPRPNDHPYECPYSRASRPCAFLSPDLRWLEKPPLVSDQSSVALPDLPWCSCS